MNINQVISSLTAILLSLQASISGLPPTQNLAQVAPTNGLIAHWQLDDASGTSASDSSGNGRVGTLVGGPIWGSGRINGGLDFSGTNYVSVGDVADNANAITVSAWFRATSADTSHLRIFFEDNSIDLRRNASERFSFQVFNAASSATADSDAVYADTSWHHVVGVFDGSNVDLYVDGVDAEATARPLAGPIRSSSGDLSLSASFAGMNGTLDDLRIYNRALSASEIANIYNDTGGTPPPPTPINGSCGTTVNSCSSGTFSDTADTSSNYLWQCNGSNGGTNASCSLPITPSDTTPPSTPTNLSATAISSSQINLSWSASTDNTAVTAYDIYRNGTLLTSTSNTSYSNTGLFPSTSYSYTVRARDAAGNASSQSTSVSATTQAQTTPPPPTGTTFYIRDGGTGNCSDWTNACDTLPATLQRGATYYIADGTYPSYTFDDPVSGTQLITIKKATISDHGTNTGWSNTYGDGQAEFTAVGTVLVFDTPYWLFDGQTGSGQSGYGFKISVTGTSDATRGISVRAGNLTIAHSEITSVNTLQVADAARQDGIYTTTAAATNVNIKNNYIHNWKRCAVLASGTNSWTIENNFIYRTYSTSGAHGQSIQFGPASVNNMVIRNNIFKDTHGTGVIVYLDNVFDNIKIYGNLFWHTGEPAAIGINSTSQAIGSTNGDTATNVKIFNNTFVGMRGRDPQPSGGIDHNGTPTGNEAYNNLWYDSLVTFDSTTHDYNAFFLSSNQSEPNVQSGSNNPFLNLPSGDFRLSSPTQRGITLSSEYGTDIFGNIRGQDGSWDRGAYEYSGTGTPPPPPTSYTIQSSAGTGGTISPSGSVSVQSGGSQTFTITPNTGYSIQSVTVNGTSVGTVSTYTFSNITSNQSIFATFTQNTTPVSTTFSSGQRVQATPGVGSNLNVRSTASASATLLGTQPHGSLGTIVSGGTQADGYYWWNVNFDSGVDGYVVENYLTAYTTPPPPPSGSLISADHNAVTAFDQIPDYWIEQVKSRRMLQSFMGASHARQIHNGLRLLESQNAKYNADVNYNPSLYVNENALRDLTGRYTGSWTDTGGADTYWLTDSARTILRNTLNQAGTITGTPVVASFYGWSYHMCSPSYASGSIGHPFSDADLALYLDTVLDFNADPAFPSTQFVYTTSVLDGACNTTTDNAYNTRLWNEQIRQAAQANGEYLFDQADIENWNNTNTSQRVATDYLGRTIYLRNSDYDESVGSNTGDSYYGVDHTNDALDLRKAKALWWLMARMAGWDGVTTGGTSDTQAPSTPTNPSASVISSSQINLSWSPSTDDTGVTGYRIYRNGTQLTTTVATSYQNTGLSPSTLYTYTIQAYDAAGNSSSQSTSVSATTQTDAPPPVLSTLFTPGQRVQATPGVGSNLNVRSTASASGTLLGTQPHGSLGTIINGGQSADGYYWWNVNFDSGVDGYVVENYISAHSAPKAGDLNQDGLVNSIDLSLLTSRWNQNYSAYDLNSDGTINSLDYVVMVQNWTL